MRRILRSVLLFGGVIVIVGLKLAALQWVTRNHSDALFLVALAAVVVGTIMWWRERSAAKSNGD